MTKAQEDDSGGRGSALALAFVEQSFAAMDNEVRYKWARGTMVQMGNGLYATVFSEEDLAKGLHPNSTLPQNWWRLYPDAMLLAALAVVT